MSKLIVLACDVCEHEWDAEEGLLCSRCKKPGEVLLNPAGVPATTPKADVSPWRPDAVNTKAHVDAVRTFGSGATRDVDVGKFDYEGFLSPTVIEAFGRYMNVCRSTASGLRDSDNWQKGIPLPVYVKSKWRHDLDVWKAHRGLPTKEHQLVNLMAVLFNTFGYAHELLKTMTPAEIDYAFDAFEKHRAVEIADRRQERGAA